jgi:hypothetical protein
MTDNSTILVKVAVHLQNGTTVETELVFPADIDDDEVQQELAEQLKGGGWTTVGDLNVHTNAIAAVELL